MSGGKKISWIEALQTMLAGGTALRGEFWRTTGSGCVLMYPLLYRIEDDILQVQVKGVWTRSVKKYNELAASLWALPEE